MGLLRRAVGHGWGDGWLTSSLPTHFDTDTSEGVACQQEPGKCSFECRMGIGARNLHLQAVSAVTNARCSAK